MLLCRKLEHNLQTFISFMAASYPTRLKTPVSYRYLNYFTIIEEIRAHKWDISMFTDLWYFISLEQSNEVFIYLFVCFCKRKWTVNTSKNKGLCSSSINRTVKFMKARNMHGFCEFGEGKGTASALESKRMSVPNIN